MKATNRIDGRRADIAIAKMLRDMAYALARRQGGFRARAVATAHSRHRMLLEINPLLRPGGHVTRADAEIEAALWAAAAEIARDDTRSGRPPCSSSRRASARRLGQDSRHTRRQT